MTGDYVRENAIRALFFVTVFALSSTTTALFPGRAPDEGDVRHLYASCTVAVLLGEHSYALPFLLGWLENLEYPKKRLHIELFLQASAHEDTTAEQIKWWSSQTAPVFASITVHGKELGKNNALNSWEETALSSARRRKSHYILFFTGDSLFYDVDVLNRELQTKNVVTSILMAAPLDGDWWNVPNEDGEVEYALKYDLNESPLEVDWKFLATPFFIRITSPDAEYLTFDSQNLVHFQDTIVPQTPLKVLSISAARMSISLYLSRARHIGWHFGVQDTRRVKATTMQYLEADLIADYGPMALPISRTVRPWKPPLSKFSFDKVYVINLARRPERRAKMEAICAVIGLDCEMFEATDGSLKEFENEKIKQLKEYSDPFHKRPMKRGEIGCFLSHYRIWLEVKRASFSRVLVLEDDIRFRRDALSSLTETMEDLEDNDFEWGLVYIGRKILPEHSKKDVWVPDIRHLSTVGYTYWTIGYALSSAGAESLLRPRPLSKMVPVDEYIPIMGDVHPNREWSAAFEERNLRLFTVYPLLVFPQKYVSDPNYVSDTEASDIISEDVGRGAKEEL